MLLTLTFGNITEPFDVNEDWNVLFIKQRACQIFNLNADNIFLSLTNIPLDECQKVSDLKLVDNCPVFIRSRIPKNHFFVFCYTCEDIIPALMKYSCILCNSPKFTPVFYDKETRVCHGKCDNESCHCQDGKIDFCCYKFNDHSHNVFLNQFERNLSFITCAACLSDESNIIVKFCKNESHYICLECFKNYALEYFDSGLFQLIDNTGYTLGCPGGCRNSFIGDPHHFRILGSDFYSRYKEQSIARYIHTSDFVFCPNCGMNWEINNNANHAVQIDASNWHTCLAPGGCGVIFCSFCNWFTKKNVQNSHEINESQPILCYCQSKSKINLVTATISKVSAVWKLINTKNSDQESKALISNTCRPCPSCKSPTEKSGGCNHIHCSICDFDWCWVCCELWTGECQSSHWF